MSPGTRARALPVGATLDRGFALLGRRPRALLVPPIVLHLVPLVVAVLLALLGVVLLGDVATTSEQVRESTFFGDSTLETRDVATLTDGQWATVAVLATVAGLVAAWFAAAAYAAMILAARRADEGAPPLGLGASVAAGLRAAPRLFAVTVLVAVAVGVVAAVGWVVVRALYRAGGLPGLGLGGLLGGGVAVVVAIRLALLPVVVVVERRGLDAFARSWRLTAGRFWPLLGLTLLLLVALTAISVVVTLLLEALFGALNALETAVGSWLLVPYGGLLLVLSAVYAAGLIAPLVVAHGRLARADD